MSRAIPTQGGKHHEPTDDRCRRGDHRRGTRGLRRRLHRLGRRDGTGQPARVEQRCEPVKLELQQRGGPRPRSCPTVSRCPTGRRPQGDAITSDTLTIADYTVADGKKAYDGLVTDLPKAGWTISAKSWSDDLGSGTLTAAGNGTDVKLLVLDKDLSLSIKKS